MGLQARIFNASHSREINDAFTTIARDGHEALLVGADPYFVVRRAQLVTLAARHAIPTLYNVRDYVEAGGLMSYGTNAVDAYREVGVYAGRIFKGVKPTDLPVVQSSKFELVINLATAMMLGLDVPPTLLARADEVIE
jgi:putative tryptophan/tyrosine transport system substrate-binding protein